MKIAVPTSWDNILIKNLEEINSINKNIVELYGSLPISPIGSGRPSASLPNVSLEEAKEHIEFTHSSGFFFNYILNAPCIGGLEYNQKYARRIMSYIDTIILKLNPDMLTISIPFLIEKIKKEYPFIKIKASAEARIDTASSAKFYEEIGVSRICLDSNINRNFAMLKDITGSVNCEVEVIVNKSCLFKCPIRVYHGSLMGHISQEIFSNISSYPASFDYPSLKCTLKKLTCFEEIIKSPWIRPEDCSVYEKLGILNFKISGRTKPTEWIIRGARAYSNRKYEGNLLDLLDMPKPIKMERVYSLPLFVPNNELNGFLDFFRDLKCTEFCDKCDYCEKVAQSVVKIISWEKLKKDQDIIEHLLSNFIEDIEEKSPVDCDTSPTQHNPTERTSYP